MPAMIRGTLVLIFAICAFSLLARADVVCNGEADYEFDCAGAQACRQTQIARLTSYGYPDCTTNDYVGPIQNDNGDYEIPHAYGYACSNNGLGGEQGSPGCKTRTTGPNSAPMVPEDGGSGPGPKCVNASIISVDNLSLGESIPIVGAKFSLMFSSSRVRRPAENRISLPMTTTLDPRITALSVKVVIAGRTFNQNFDPTVANQTYEFVWDGKDSAGNYVNRATSAGIFQTITWSDLGAKEAFFTKSIGSIYPQSTGLGGWLLTNHHDYDADANMLYLGDGRTFRTPWLKRSNGDYWVTYPGSDEIYVFSDRLVHLQTLDSLTGAAIWTFAYDINGLLQTITDAYANVTTISRNTAGQPISIQAPFGQVTAVTYDSNNHVTSVTNPALESYVMTYLPGSNLLASFSLPSGTQSIFTYDGFGYVSSDESHSGHVLNFNRAIGNSNGSLVNQTSMSTGMGYISSLTTSYDPGTNTNSRSVANPDSSGESVSSVNALDNSGNAHFASQSENINSSQTYVADARLGSLGYFLSDSIYLGREVTSTQTLTGSDIFNFTKIAESYTTDTNQTSQWSYQPSIKTNTYTSSVGRIAKTVLNAQGDVISIQKASFAPVNLTLNSAGYVTQVSQSARSEVITYNAQGLVATDTNPLSQITSYSYDLAGRPTTITLPDTRTILYEYNSNGKVKKITTPSGGVHLLSHNLFEKLMDYVPPLLGTSNSTTHYDYNIDGQLTQITKPSGVVIQLAYDATSGKNSSITTVDGVTSLVWSQNVIQQISNTNYSESPSFAGGVASMPAGWSFNFGNNIFAYANLSYNHNLVNSMVFADANGTQSTTAYTYDNDDLLKVAGSMTLTHNTATGLVTSTSIGQLASTETYDATYGELTSREYKANGTSIYNQVYTRDSGGRLSHVAETIQGTLTGYDYAYDSRGRLVTVQKNSSTTGAYTYDYNGNRLTAARNGGASVTYSYNAQDQLSGATDGSTFSYSLDGNLSTMAKSGATSTYGFDTLGSLTSFQKGSISVTYLSDLYGRRLKKTKNGAVNQYYVYQNETQLVALLNSSGVVTARFIYGESSNVPDYIVKGSVSYRLIYDAIGSVRLVVRTSNSTVAQRIDYDEFGRVTADSSPGFQPFGFGGGIYDSDTGLVHFGARDYDPEVGRWLSKDPILFKGGDTNLYGYVLQDPINKIDPSGLFTVCGTPYPGLGICFNGDDPLHPTIGQLPPNQPCIGPFCFYPDDNPPLRPPSNQPWTPSPSANSCPAKPQESPSMTSPLQSASMGI